MARYVVIRLVQAVPVLLGVSVIVFFLVRMTGDPAVLMLGPGAPKDAIEEFRAEYGLDRPLVVQFGQFMADAFRLDFGQSVREHRSAAAVVLDRLPATLQLAGAALAIAILVGVPLGVVAAVKARSWVGRSVFLATTVTQGVPVFYSALMLQLVIGARLGLLPTSGSAGLRYLVLPAVSLGLYFGAVVARVMRASMMEILPSPFLVTARAKGVSRLGVLTRHATRNAFVPVVSVLGLQFGNLLGGAVIIESIFGWPGIGRLALTSITARDFPVVQAVVLLSAVVFIVVNLAVDILYARLDPRIKYDR